MELVGLFNALRVGFDEDCVGICGLKMLIFGADNCITSSLSSSPAVAVMAGLKRKSGHIEIFSQKRNFMVCLYR